MAAQVPDPRHSLMSFHYSAAVSKCGYRSGLKCKFSAFVMFEHHSQYPEIQKEGN